MDDSILISTKRMLGINDDISAFDQEILMNINSIFGTLYQIGIGRSPYSITGDSETWNDLFLEYKELISLIKDYVFVKITLMFDPPSSSFVLDAKNHQAQELEWRISIQNEFSDSFKEVKKEDIKQKHKKKCHFPKHECAEEVAMKPISNQKIEELWNKGE